MTRLSISLLGAFRICHGDGESVCLTLEKAQALLAYLVTEADHPVPREMLAALLWPETSERQARTNLRQVLHRLRQALGDNEHTQPCFSISPQTIQFNTSPDDYIDVSLFTSLLDNCRVHRHSALEECPACLDRMRQAVDLYHGDFLTGIVLPDSDYYQEWAAIKRADLSNRVLDTLAFLVEWHERAGDLTQARRYVGRQLDMEPWNEDAHRHKMSILARTGHRMAALKQYEICRNILATELGIEPARETTTLFEHIRDGEGECGQQYPTSRLIDPALAPPQTKDSGQPFLGFQNELSILNAALAATLNGHSNIVVVTGEQGAGKSALVEHFLQQAILEHADLLCAYSSAGHGAAEGEYCGILCDALSKLLGVSPGQVANGRQDTLTPPHNLPRRELVMQAHYRTHTRSPASMASRTIWQDELSDLTSGNAIASGTPSTHAALGKMRPEPRMTRNSDNTARPSLCEEVESFPNFQSQPIVFVLDDMQWADDASIALLHALPKRYAYSRILFVFVHRFSAPKHRVDGALATLNTVLRELRSGSSFTEIDLDERDGRDFVKDYLRTASCKVSGQFSQRLFESTRGHPLFTIEVVQSLKRNGALVEDSTGSWIEAAHRMDAPGMALDRDHLPIRVEAIIADRLATLSLDDRAILETAAIQGDAFCAEVAARMLHSDEEAMITLFSDLFGREHHLVKAIGVSHRYGVRVSQYGFRQPLMRRYLYDHLDDVRRTHLHEACALAMEAYFDEGTDNIAAELIAHFEAAGCINKAIHYHRRAAESAMRSLAYADATAHLRAGLALLECVPESQERRKTELQISLDLTVTLLATDWRETDLREQTCRRALELSAQAGDSVTTCRALFANADLVRSSGDLQKAHEISEQMLAIAQHAEEPGLLLLAEVSLGEACLVSGDLMSARRHLLRAVAKKPPSEIGWIQGTTLYDPYVSSLCRLSWVLLALGEIDQAQLRRQEALARAENHAPSLALAIVLADLCFTWLMHTPELDEKMLGRLNELMDQHSELAFVRPWTKVFGGWSACRRQRANRCIVEIRQGIADWEPAGTLAERTLQALMLAEAYAMMCNFEEGLQVLDHRLQAMAQIGTGFFGSEVHRRRAALLLQQAQHFAEPQYEASVIPPEVEIELRVAIELARVQHATLWELRASIDLYQLLRLQGRKLEARSILAPLSAWFPQTHEFPDLCKARNLLEQLD